MNCCFEGRSGRGTSLPNPALYALTTSWQMQPEQAHHRKVFDSILLSSCNDKGRGPRSQGPLYSFRYRSPVFWLDIPHPLDAFPQFLPKMTALFLQFLELLRRDLLSHRLAPYSNMQRRRGQGTASTPHTRRGRASWCSRTGKTASWVHA